MSIWHIYGGNRLTGSTQVQGAKNAVLPIMAASVLAGSETVLHNVPDLKDVKTPCCAASSPATVPSPTSSTRSRRRSSKSPLKFGRPRQSKNGGIEL